MATRTWGLASLILVAVASVVLLMGRPFRRLRRALPSAPASAGHPVVRVSLDRAEGDLPGRPVTVVTVGERAIRISPVAWARDAGKDDSEADALDRAWKEVERAVAAEASRTGASHGEIVATEMVPPADVVRARDALMTAGVEEVTFHGAGTRRFASPIRPGRPPPPPRSSPR